MSGAIRCRLQSDSQQNSSATQWRYKSFQCPTVWSSTMLYEFMTARRDEILGRCLADLRNQYPNYTDEDLTGELPSFFNQVITALRNDLIVAAEDPPTPISESVVAQHTARRKDQGFDQSRLVRDLGLICDKVTEVGSLYGQTFRAREVQILNRCLDDAIAKAVDTFSEHA